MNARRRGRLAVALLALVYVLGGTNLVLGILDRIAPLPVSAVADTSHSHAGKACCCGDASQCHGCGCCPAEDDPPSPATERAAARTISYLALARCAGQGSPSTAPLGGPDHQSAPGAVLIAASAPELHRLAVSTAREPAPAPLSPTSKIPI